MAKISKFKTRPLTSFLVQKPVSVVVSLSVLIVGGGGGGGADLGGGGGGGEVAYGSLDITRNIEYAVTVGNGGPVNAAGSTSTFWTETVNGGGRGGSNTTYDTSSPGKRGGNATNPGGGCGGDNATGADIAGTSTGTSTGILTRYGGYAAGNGGGGGPYNGGGGGGAGAGSAGAGGGSQVGGNGGNGVIWPVDGAYYGGGGGGNSRTDRGAANSSGGLGGGGRNNIAGTDNTGGGGGGGGAHYNAFAGAGGKGVIKIRYPDSYSVSLVSGNLLESTSSAGGFKITSFTSGSGNFKLI